jgi:predicted ATP-grasp superfamily ATP-dependent carboligase
VILPSDSITTRLLSDLRSLLNVPVFPVPDLHLFDCLDKKDKFAELCQHMGVVHPSVRLYDDRHELVQALERGEVALPVIAKPTNRSGGIGVVKIVGAGEQRAVETIRYSPILVQDFIEGEDVCLSFFCEAGKPLLEISYTFLNGMFHLTHDERALNAGRQIVDALRLNGIINFDLRVSSSGSVYVIECNPRCWFNMDIALAAGFNFIAPGLPDRYPARNGIARDVAAQIRTPRRTLSDLLRMRRVSAGDLWLLGYWLRDPVVFLLGLVKYQRSWSSRWLERALTFRTSRDLARQRHR